MLVNPADRLAELVNACRSTVLVGGTMEPAQLLVQTLSRGSVSADSIRRFSCDHVIDDSQLLAITVEKTIDKKSFKLTYDTRSDEMTLKSLATSLQALVQHLPSGVVIFVPSYDFLFNFQKKMREFGVMRRIEVSKILFLKHDICSRKRRVCSLKVNSRLRMSGNGSVVLRKPRKAPSSSQSLAEK